MNNLLINPMIGYLNYVNTEMHTMNNNRMIVCKVLAYDIFLEETVAIYDIYIFKGAFIETKENLTYEQLLLELEEFYGDHSVPLYEC